MLMGKLLGAGGVGGKSHELTDVFYDDNSTSTFTNRNLGTPASDRIIVVMMSWGYPHYSSAVSVSVGGVALTTGSFNIGNGANPPRSQIAYGVVPSGSTGTVQLGGQISRLIVGIYALYGFDSATPVYQSSMDGQGYFSVNVDKGGLAIDVSVTVDGATTANTVSNLTVDYESGQNGVPAASSSFHAAGSKLFTSAASSVPIGLYNSSTSRISQSMGYWE